MDLLHLHPLLQVKEEVLIVSTIPLLWKEILQQEAAPSIMCAPCFLMHLFLESRKELLINCACHRSKRVVSCLVMDGRRGIEVTLYIAAFPLVIPIPLLKPLYKPFRVFCHALKGLFRQPLKVLTGKVLAHCPSIEVVSIKVQDVLDGFCWVIAIHERVVAYTHP